MPIRKRPVVNRPGLNRPSVTEQIEAMPRIATHEMAWVKEPGEPLRKAALWRGRNSVWPNPFKQGKEEIHTHPNVEGGIAGAFPSKGDLRCIRIGIDSALNLSLFRNKKWVVPTDVIVSTNKAGKEIGRTIIRPRADMKMEVVEKALMQDENAIKRHIKEFRDLEEKVEALHELAEKHRFEALKAIVMLPDDVETHKERRMQRAGIKKMKATLKEVEKTSREIISTLEKMGFKMRFMAKPGYWYNPYRKCFEKKR